MKQQLPRLTNPHINGFFRVALKALAIVGLAAGLIAGLSAHWGWFICLAGGFLLARWLLKVVFRLLRLLLWIAFIIGILLLIF